MTVSLYIATKGSCVMRRMGSTSACATSMRSNGSWWWGG